MVPDTKRYCRLQIGYLLKKLCKRFTAEELTKLVPGNDEVTHRRLKKIRKQLRRDVRKKISDDTNEKTEDSEDEFVAGLEKKSATWVLNWFLLNNNLIKFQYYHKKNRIDDILADSESDLSDLDESENVEAKKSKKSGKKKEMFILEEPGEIVDLADIKSIGNVLSK